MQKIPEGKRLREPQWARELGVNRMALRDAFARLEAEGLIVRGPATGYFVPTLTPQDIAEIIQLRIALWTETRVRQLLISVSIKRVSQSSVADAALQ